MHAGGSGHNGGERRNVLIVSVLLSTAIYFALRSETQGGVKVLRCDSKPFCCTWQLLPILSCVMDKSKTRLRLPAGVLEVALYLHVVAPLACAGRYLVLRADRVSSCPEERA